MFNIIATVSWCIIFTKAYANINTTFVQLGDNVQLHCNLTCTNVSMVEWKANKKIVILKDVKNDSLLVSEDPHYILQSFSNSNTLLLISNTNEQDNGTTLVQFIQIITVIIP
ncbi:putative immunoglobulin-like domain containing protein [Namao virus]|nr:putative immunoglobulin-like domain containing protein [Namao virus]